MSYAGIFTDKNNTDHPITSTLYGTCATAANEAAKVVVCTDFDTLLTGVTIRVKFSNGNTAENPTININSTGAKSVFRFGSTTPVGAGSWEAGAVVELTYDGTSFFMTNSDNIAAKQNVTDNTLQTTDKTVPGAINELKSGLTTLNTEVNGDATTYPYADVITIPDAVPANLADCTVKIEPEQNLHGYDHPWVGGAGANKLPVPYETASGSTINNMTITYDSVGVISLNGSANNDLIPIFDGTLSSDTYYLVSEQSTSSTRVTLSINGTVVTNQDYDDAPYQFTTDGTERIILYVKTISGTLTNAVVKPMITNTNVTAWQPYTNICPITGHTETSVQRDGVNLFNVSTITTGKGISEDSSIVDSGISCVSDYIRVMPNTNYYLTARDDTVSRRIGFYDQYKNNLQASSAATGSRAFTTPANCAYCRISVNTSYADETQLELGSSATDYEPFKGKTYTIALGDTIYGGRVRIDSNGNTVMDVDRAERVFDGSEDENWSVVDSGKRAKTTILIGSIKPTLVEEVADIISSAFEAVTAIDTYLGNTGISVDAASVVYVANGTTMDTASWNAYLASNPLQVCYELATPTTIQLTPQQIRLLKGHNTLTASTGQISVTVNGVSGAIGSLTSDKQDKTDYELETTAKTVVGGINELKDRVKVIEITMSDTVDQGTTVKVPSGYDAARAVIVGYTARRSNNLWYNADDHVAVGMYSEYLYAVPKNADVLEQTVKVILVKFSA